MKHLIAVTAVCLTLTPVWAEDQKTSPEIDEGMSLMEQGARLFLRGLMDEVDPAMEDLKDFAQTMQPNLQKLLDEMGPSLQSLADMMDNATAYEAPEKLPNGDIIIRRKPDQPTQDAPEIDL